jgi:hypothetical protein
LISSKGTGSDDAREVYFWKALTFAHRALCAAAIFLRADADMVRFGFGA